jgi:chromosome segregation ATPase
MGNFAVSASEEIINQGNALLEKLQKPGDKKGDTLKHLFEIVEANIDTDQMQQGGIDTRKLDASLSNIRSMFVSMVGGQEEILASYQAKIDNVKALKDKLEEELTGKIAEAREAKEIAEKKADEATKAMEQALKDLKVAEDKATSSDALTAETRKNNETLQTELSKAKEQLAGYDDLKKSEFENKTAVINLRHELSEKEKEYTDALKSKEVECKHQIEQIQSSAELEKEKALIAKEREMNEKIRELDRENAKLQAQIEQLQQK